MSATFGVKNTTLKMVGDRVNVPNNAIARLIYYLNCVVTAIQ